MAKQKGSKPFTKYELNFIRHGIYLNWKGTMIAHRIGRGKHGGYQCIERLRNEGTLNRLDFLPMLKDDFDDE